MKDDEVPEAFNTHLYEVGKRLSDKFGPYTDPSRSTFADVATLFEFKHITTNEVNELVSKIKIYKSSAVTGLTS